MYIFDIDGTLSKPGERLKYLQQKPKNFDAFYDGMINDKINNGIASVYRSLVPLYHVALVTGRPERYRQTTLDWLLMKNLYPFRIEIWMRKDGDYRPDYVVKSEIVKEIGLELIDCIFEDRQQVVDAYRELGLTVCQVAEGNY